MYLRPIYMPNAAIHSSLHPENNESLHYLTEISKAMLALTIRLLLTFNWIRVIKAFLNMHAYATQSQKTASVTASTATSTEQGVPLVTLN